ncbi:hypothetical protein BH11ACT3_BH11ACT3_09660 [soil metagenome]
MHDLPDELRLGPFSVREARQLGFSRHALRRADLVTPFHGARLPTSSADDFEETCRAYASRMPPGHHFSHGTAARLWGLRIPRRLVDDRVLDVTAVPPAWASRSNGVRGHTSKTEAPVLLRELPVSGPVDTWVAMAADLSVEELLIVGDGLVRRKNPPATLADLRSAIEKSAGRPGHVRLESALRRVRAGTDSRRETELRELLVAAGLPEPQVNGEISLPGAAKKRFGDLVYRDQGVVVEYDGGHHSADRRTYVDDLERAEELRHMRFVHVVKEHWSDPAEIAAKVEAALIERGWTRTRARRRIVQTLRAAPHLSPIRPSFRRVEVTARDYAAQAVATMSGSRGSLGTLVMLT